MAKIKYFFIGLMFVGCIWQVQDCSAFSSADEFNTVFEDILNEYSLEDEDAKLASLLDDYLQETTGFNNKEYQTSCRQLALEYAEALIELGKCSDEATEKEKMYSSQWVEDLVEQFGKSYVSNNMDLIKLNLKYLYSRNMVNSCKELEKEVVYREHSCKVGYNAYISVYMDFFENLDEEQKKILSKRKAAVELLMDIVNKASIQDIIADSALRTSLLETATKDRPGSDEMLNEFFLKHPYFSKPFNVIKCINDLIKVTEK